MWRIDDEGRIFYEGQFVAQIHREPRYDGRYTTAFRVMRVEVPRTDDLRLDSLFETAIIGTSEIARVSASEWNALNIGESDA